MSGVKGMVGQRYTVFPVGPWQWFVALAQWMPIPVWMRRLTLCLLY